MHVRGLKKKLYLAGVTVALLSSGVAATKGTAEAAETEEPQVVTADEASEEGDTAPETDETDPEAETTGSEAEDAEAKEETAEETAPVEKGEEVTEDEAATESETEEKQEEDAADAGAEEDAAQADPVNAGGEIQYADQAETGELGDLAVSEGENGWVEEDGKKYYYVNGEKVKQTVMLIDGEYYGFATDGRLYVSSTFSAWNSGKSKYIYHRADKNGVLLRSTWYDNGSSLYYFDEHSDGLDGICKVEGTEYLFDAGVLVRNNSTTIDGTAYAGDSEGKPVKLKKNGWTKAGDRYYYTIEGVLQKNRIIIWDGDYYLVDNRGRMVDDGTYSFYNSDMGRTVYYRAKKGGILYRREWYEDTANGAYYYYTAEGHAPYGYTKMGSTYFAFDYEGRAVISRLITFDDVLYVADENGHAKPVTKKTGWVDAGAGIYYYVLDGTAVTSRNVEIDGKIYAFDYYGQLYKNTTFNRYDDGVYHYYRAKKDGTIYRNEWVEADGEWYYYGKDGVAAEGFLTFGKTTYCFYNGRMQTNTQTTDDEENVWFINSKGVAKKAPENGWITVEGEKYYFQDRVMQKSRIIEIDGKKYGFDYYGKLEVNCRFYMGGYYHRADKNGVLLTNTWYKDEYYNAEGNTPWNYITVKGKGYYISGANGKAVCSAYVCYDGKTIWYANGAGILSEVKKDGLYRLYDNTVMMLSGGALVKDAWKKVDGTYYFFDSFGCALTENGYVDEKVYVFYPDGTIAKNGWINLYGKVYYAKADGELLIGEQTIDGKHYYFYSDGAMVTGFYNIGGKCYLFGSDGARIGGARKDGWYKVEGEWYYIQDGYPISNGPVTIGENTYYFMNGKMRRNYIDSSSNKHVFGKDGMLVKRGWVKVNGYWFYVDPETGKYSNSEFKTIGGKSYYFDYYGELLIGTRQIGDVLVTTDANGVIKKRDPLKKGWTLVNGEYHFVDSTGYKYYTGWVGNYYVNNGVLETNSVVDDDYLVDDSGKWIKTQGWHTMIYQSIFEYIDEIKAAGYTLKQVLPKYYVKKNGKIARNEWLKLGGYWYYFASQGEMVRGLWTEGKKYHYMDDNGRWVKTLDSPDEGWYQFGKEWLYIDGNTYYHTVTLYGKDYYLNPYMVSNKVASNYSSYHSFRDGYYYGKSGAADKTLSGWNKINEKWYYFLKDGRAVCGWVSLGKKRYYIDEEDGMVTGPRAIDGQLYIFDKNGVLTKQVVKMEGWYKGPDGWYYYQNGKLTYSYEVCIDGEYYSFMEGKMVTNRMVDGYYYGKDGKRVRNQWKKLEGYWFYFGADGYSVNGEQTIGGKKYLFGFAGNLVKEIK